MAEPPAIAVLGASGLIGQALAEALRGEGFPIVAIARRFTPAQKAAFDGEAVETPLVGLDPQTLAQILAERGADVAVNCLGVLQDGPRGRTDDVHRHFVRSLIGALKAQPRPVLLVHMSIPGRAEDDRTAFSRSKREAEALIQASGLAFAILRPGFVIAPAAYGGGAVVRALAGLPIALSPPVGERPFAVLAISDIVGTVKAAAALWREKPEAMGAVWEMTARSPSSVAEVVAAFRRRFGGPEPLVRLPGWLLRAGAVVGDMTAWLGWAPPIRSTALKEMLRGVDGDPTPWIEATGIEPLTLEEALAGVPATVQEAWFARLFLLKPLVLGGLALFWIVSGMVALGPGFAAASAILGAHGVGRTDAGPITWATGLADIGVGLAIAVRRTARAGLVAGLALSLGYVAAATFIAPALWLDPLGPLVKVAPALILMLVGLAILGDR